VSENSSLYDLSMIEQIAHGNQDFIKKMINMFIDTMPTAIAEMKDHQENGNWPALGAVAHKVKPTIDTLGITSLKEDVRSMEKYGKDLTNLDEIPSMLSNFDHVIGQVIEDMKSKL